MSQRLAHPSKRYRQLLEYELSIEPEHPVAQASELPIAPGIGSATMLVAPAVNFDHQLGLRSGEVSNEVTDGILPAKRRAQLTRANGDPQRLFGCGRAGSHELRSVLQKLLGFRIEAARAHRGSPSPAEVAGLCDPLAQEA